MQEETQYQFNIVVHIDKTLPHTLAKFAEAKEYEMFSGGDRVGFFDSIIEAKEFVCDNTPFEVYSKSSNYR